MKKQQNPAGKTIIKFFIFLFAVFMSVLSCEIISIKAEGESVPPLPSTDRGITVKAELPQNVMSGVPFKITLSLTDPQGEPVQDFKQNLQIGIHKGTLYHYVENRQEPLTEISEDKWEKGTLTLSDVVVKDAGGNSLTITGEGIKTETPFRAIPGILSILPPLLAIILALTMKQVIISIFCGIWLGATFIYNYNPWVAFLRVLDKYMVEALADSGHASIIAFSLFLGGMVAILSASGGTQGMVDVISKKANTPKTGQFYTWLMGVIIFFDDYANTLLVGNSMRPLTDKLRISREKLSFIVDATAAPVTNIAIISTWIGFELGLIADGIQQIGLGKNAYMIFAESIPNRFYPVLLLAFVLMVALTERDFSTMLTAEIRARKTGKVLADGASPLSSVDEIDIKMDTQAPRRWFNALIPIISMIGFTLAGLWMDGCQTVAADKGSLEGVAVYDILGSADSLKVLLWSSIGGSLVAIVMVLWQKIMNLEKVISVWVEGVKSIIPAVIILTLAWSIGAICKDLDTAGYVALIAKGTVSPHLLPILIFIISAVISFATGTSWGTMSIVMPIAIHIGWNLPPQSLGESMRYSIFLGTISGVLSGATFGDHCSPISDTTIMSSMTSGADHIDHVKTQMPYALTVGAVGAFLGYIPAGWGVNPVISIILSIAVLYAILRLVGKNPEEEAKKDKEGYIPIQSPTTPGEDKEPLRHLHAEEKPHIKLLQCEECGNIQRSELDLLIAKAQHVKMHLVEDPRCLKCESDKLKELHDHIQEELPSVIIESSNEIFKLMKEHFSKGTISFPRETEEQLKEIGKNLYQQGGHPYMEQTFSDVLNMAQQRFGYLGQNRLLDLIWDGIGQWTAKGN